MRTISRPLRAVEHAQGCRRDDVRPQPLADAEIDQDARGIGRELDAGAGFLEPLGLFQHDDAKAVTRKRKRRRKPANAGAGDDDACARPSRQRIRR